MTVMAITVTRIEFSNWHANFWELDSKFASCSVTSTGINSGLVI
jgi:hypothetical protein